MMGFGTGLPLVIAFGFLVLGPKRMHAILEQLARTKAEFEKASCDLKSQIAAEFEMRPRDTRKTEATGQEPTPNGPS